MTEDILRDQGINVDRIGFEKLMEEQRTRGRETRIAAAAGIAIGTSNVVGRSPALGQLPCTFVGYDRLEGESSVIGIFGNGGSKIEAVAGEEIKLLTAETPF